MLKWIRNLFSSKKYVYPLTPEQDNYIDNILRDNTIHLQEMEDWKWDRIIEKEARRMYNEWKDIEPVKIGDKEYNPYIPLVNLPAVYMVYNRNTKKYNGDEAHKKVMEMFNKMIEEHGKETI